MQLTEGAWERWQVADVVCHELAYLWFGNLVTAVDWEDSTVNEVCPIPSPPLVRVPVGLEHAAPICVLAAADG